MRDFQIVDAEQRSEAWLAVRLGCITASRAGDIVATIKSGEAAARRDYRLQLVCERLTGQPQEDIYVNADMQRGMDLEPRAFAAYESVTGQVVTRVGFVRHLSLMAGASPDGVIGDFDGLVELKCPRSATHLKYLRAGTVPPDHLPQLLHQLWITGAGYVDFVSFDPRFPEPWQVFIARLTRTAAAIGEYESKALAFLSEVDRECEAIGTMANVGGVLREAVEA